MNLQELRIGNYVEYSTISNDFNKVFRRIYVRDLIRIEESDYYYIYNPIPLTEEFLLKCGFEKRSNEVYFFNVGLFYFEWICEEGLYLEGMGLDVDFLHQLQNLIFSLSGKELEINL